MWGREGRTYPVRPAVGGEGAGGVPQSDLQPGRRGGRVPYVLPRGYPSFPPPDTGALIMPRTVRLLRSRRRTFLFDLVCRLDTLNFDLTISWRFLQDLSDLKTLLRPQSDSILRTTARQVKSHSIQNYLILAANTFVHRNVTYYKIRINKFAFQKYEKYYQNEIKLNKMFNGFAMKYKHLYCNQKARKESECAQTDGKAMPLLQTKTVWLYFIIKV